MAKIDAIFMTKTAEKPYTLWGRTYQPRSQGKALGTRLRTYLYKPYNGVPPEMKPH